ncbi:flippase-like domain-containing protein [Arthrobacter sp. zg-Y826]|uniref:lysylphosphatidylglycerol synthase transmembrane domain-containing protein n=1 Tax=Arthrobacter jinronghuae TaxID=2964609 RepID=UPI00210637E6|nr:YbhN family protein [Arthrobacter jinronghuae]MCQ1956585.1 flippase-like domain-containing protein [Arthrobacter jinronghuae]
MPRHGFSARGSRHSSRRRRYLRAMAVAVVLVLVFEYAVLPQLVGIDNVLRSLAGLPLIVLVGALCLEVTSWLSYSALTRVVLPGTSRPSYFTLVRIDLCDTAINHVVPGGGTTSAAARFRLLTLSGSPPQDALSAATIQVLGANLVLGALFGIGLLSMLGQVNVSGYYAAAGAVVLALFVLVVVLLTVLNRHLAGAVRVVRSVAGAVPLMHPDSAEKFVRTVAGETQMFRAQPRRLLAGVALAALRWLLDAACLWVLVAAFGHVLGPGELLVAYSLAGLVSMVPLTPGGVGLVEGLLVPTLTGFGAPSHVAVLGVLSWRILQFWLPIPVGALAYVSLRLGVLRRAGRRRREIVLTGANGSADGR